MNRFALVATAVLIAGIAGVIATYARYGSLSPCDWMEQDLAIEYGLPRIVAQGQIRARFLMQGIAEPDPYDCVLEWWKLRAEGGIPVRPGDGAEN